MVLLDEKSRVRTSTKEQNDAVTALYECGTGFTM